MKLTNNFNLSEFNCKDGTPVPAELIPNVQELADNLQVLRDYLETALDVHSGYRTKKYNKKVGGVDDSKHLEAMAADISSKKYTPAQVRAAILLLIKQGKMKQGGVGLYKTFVHYDIYFDGKNVRRWDYSK